jgi:hypothetical protein
MKMEHTDYLNSLHACSAAVKYASRFPTLQDAWNTCERGDWMLWLIARTTNLNDDAQLRKLTLAKARCAALVIDKMTDERCRHAVAVAEMFGLGKATRDELDAAADAAYDAYAAYAYAAAYAAYAAYVACAAANVANAVNAAYDAYDAYAYAANVAVNAANVAAYDAKINILKQCAEITRTLYPNAPA